VGPLTKVRNLTDLATWIPRLSNLFSRIASKELRKQDNDWEVYGSVRFRSYSKPEQPIANTRRRGDHQRRFFARGPSRNHMEKTKLLDRLNESSRPVIVDFWAPWCVPCRAMAPALEQVAGEFEGQVDVIKINADESQEVLQALRIYGIPTIVGFANGMEIARKTGAQQAGSLRVFFDAIAHRQKPVNPSPTPRDRVLRAGAGLALAIFGWSALQSYLLIGVGSLLMFSAVYDRCPIYQAIAPRAKNFFRNLVRS
jgi:thioredoxin